MHDLKFQEATNIESWRHLTTERYNFIISDQVQVAYQNNLLRAHGLISIPGFAFMGGERWAAAIAKTRIAHPEVPDDSEAFAWIAKGFFDDLSGYTQEKFLDHRKEANTNSERIAQRIPPIYEAYDQLLQSSVINAWMAFEILADDLWHKVVKIRPNHETTMYASLSKDDKNFIGFRSRKKCGSLTKSCLTWIMLGLMPPSRQPL